MFNHPANPISLSRFSSINCSNPLLVILFSASVNFLQTDCVKTDGRKYFRRLSVSVTSDLLRFAFAGLPQPRSTRWRTFHQDDWHESEQDPDLRGRRRSAIDAVAAWRIKVSWRTFILCQRLILKPRPSFSVSSRCSQGTQVIRGAAAHQRGADSGWNWSKAEDPARGPRGWWRRRGGHCIVPANAALGTCTTPLGCTLLSPSLSCSNYALLPLFTQRSERKFRWRLFFF